MQAEEIRALLDSVPVGTFTSLEDNMDNNNSSINPALPGPGFYPPIIVWIEWIDSAAHAEQNIAPTDDHLTPIRCIAVGQLVTEDAAGVTLALEQFNNGCYRHAVTIPTECIIARRQIEPALESDGTNANPC